MQKCSPSNCKREAKKFCSNFEGKQYTKAQRNIWEQKALKFREECNELKKEVEVDEGVKINPYFTDKCFALDLSEMDLD